MNATKVGCNGFGVVVVVVTCSLDNTPHVLNRLYDEYDGVGDPCFVELDILATLLSPATSIERSIPQQYH
jgi:hypothetical protein